VDVYLLVAMCDNDNQDDISRIVCHARDSDHAAEVMAFSYAQWDGARQALADSDAARAAAALATRDTSRYAGGGHPGHAPDHPSWSELRSAVMTHAEKFKALRSTVMDPNGYDSNMRWRPIYRVLAIPAAPDLTPRTEGGAVVTGSVGLQGVGSFTVGTRDGGG
jgi:hypothetical protein